MINPDWHLIVKKLLKKNGITQLELARRTGIAPPSLSRILRGGSKGHIDTVIKVANALNVPISTLFGENPVTKTDICNYDLIQQVAFEVIRFERKNRLSMSPDRLANLIRLGVKFLEAYKDEYQPGEDNEQVMVHLRRLLSTYEF
ncbi:helix-turn-helix domain-containing protein [Magnetococcales bacterium HHB-1]